MDIQQQYRGLKNKMPTLLDGQLGYCTDAKELYIGSGNGNVLVGAAAFKEDISANTQALGEKLTATKTAAVDTLAEAATQADIITAFNSLIANLKASGVMN